MDSSERFELDKDQCECLYRGILAADARKEYASLVRDNTLRAKRKRFLRRAKRTVIAKSEILSLPEVVWLVDRFDGRILSALWEAKCTKNADPIVMKLLEATEKE